MFLMCGLKLRFESNITPRLFTWRVVLHARAFNCILILCLGASEPINKDLNFVLVELKKMFCHP